MILCTAYGLLIYECQISPVPDDEVEHRKEERKSRKEKRRREDQPKVSVTSQYKLSVLPDEKVLDCLSFETSQNE